MVCVSKLSIISLLSLVIADAAPKVADSPSGAGLEATFDSKISGSVFFTSQNGLVKVSVDLSGLPEFGGSFLYHIHEKPVPADGNCTATLGHFNPYNGTTDGATDALMEAGDLSGKHGVINGTSINTSYIDQYLSLNPEDPAYFGGLSVVVHFANTTRLACANITSVASSLSEVPASTLSYTGSAVSSVSSGIALVESATGNGIAIHAPGMAALGMAGVCAMLSF